MIYFIHGPDRLLAREATLTIAGNLDTDGSNTSWLDGREVSFADVASAVGAASFFNSPRIVVVTDLLARTGRDTDSAQSTDGTEERPGRGRAEIQSLVSAVPESHHLIFLEPSLSSVPTAFKNAAPGAKVIAGEPPRGSALVAWIEAAAMQAESRIDGRAAHRLAETLYPQSWDRKPSNPRYDRPPDLTLLTAEIGKLALAAYPRRGWGRWRLGFRRTVWWWRRPVARGGGGGGGFRRQPGSRRRVWWWRRWVRRRGRGWRGFRRAVTPGVFAEGCGGGGGGFAGGAVVGSPAGVVAPGVSADGVVVAAVVSPKGVVVAGVSRRGRWGFRRMAWRGRGRARRRVDAGPGVGSPVVGLAVAPVPVLAPGSADGGVAGPAVAGVRPGLAEGVGVGVGVGLGPPGAGQLPGGVGRWSWTGGPPAGVDGGAHWDPGAPHGWPAGGRCRGAGGAPGAPAGGAPGAPGGAVAGAPGGGEAAAAPQTPGVAAGWPHGAGWPGCPGWPGWPGCRRGAVASGHAVAGGVTVVRPGTMTGWPDAGLADHERLGRHVSHPAVALGGEAGDQPRPGGRSRDAASTIHSVERPRALPMPQTWPCSFTERTPVHRLARRQALEALEQPPDQQEVRQGHEGGHRGVGGVGVVGPAADLEAAGHVVAVVHDLVARLAVLEAARAPPRTARTG